MKKIVLIPDSFKGTISSTEVCGIMKKSIKAFSPLTEVVEIPVADGGEGSVDAFITALGGTKTKVIVKGPYFEDMEAYYGVINKDTAVIEMAVCAGLPLVENNKNPIKTTTYGVGQMIAHAIQSGCKKIIMGLGGSCTNDGATGVAAALGIKFFNKKGESFIPVGGTLSEIERIDNTSCIKELSDIQIVGMCDIDNPLYGPIGAAYVFGPQKGADQSMVKILDAGLVHLANKIKENLRLEVESLEGAGAAGGMGAGIVAFLGAKLQMGIETILDTVQFDKIAKGADLVFTGEGRLDSQSLRGKVICGVAKHTKALSIPLIAVVGSIEDPIEAVYEKGVTAVFSINRAPIDFSIARYQSKANLELTMDNIMRLLKVSK